MDRPLILVVDDESKIRRLIAANLETLGFDVCAAGDGEQALEVFRTCSPPPDLVILDLMMPGLDGLAALERLRAQSDVPVILVTARNEGQDKMRGFAGGADDYITKPFALDELLARVQAVLRRARRAPGAASVASDELINGPLRIKLRAHACWAAGQEIRLANTEFRLLATLMAQPGAVMTHEHLLHAVWGAAHIGEVQYLRVAFARIRRKLAQAGLDRSLISAYSGVGYVLRDLRDDTAP